MPEPQPVEIGLAAGERLLRMGEPLLAYDAVAVAQEAAPEDDRLRLLMARIHLKLGFVQKALDQLRAVAPHGPSSAEALALTGRARKDLWRAGPGDPGQLQAAVDAYSESYRQDPGIWAGVNLASLQFLAGQDAAARALARRLSLALDEALDAGGLSAEDRSWHLATLGEARLVLLDVQGARSAFHAALRLPGISREFHLSTLRNLELLGRKVDVAAIRDEFPTPTVLGFGPYGRTARSRGPVRDHLLEALGPIHSVVCGLADPWDLALAEFLARDGLPVHILLPYEPEAMARDYWEPRGMAWARVATLLDRAAQVLVLGRWPGYGDPEAVAFANRALAGYGSLRADLVEGRFLWFALDEAEGRIMEGFPARGEVRVAASGLDIQRELGPAFEPSGLPRPARRTMSVLFADVVKFSRLSEGQTCLFVERFLGMVAALIQGEGFRPAYGNTWGDGLVFDFEDPEEAGRFALRLSAQVRETDWASQGLVPGLNLRISLHAGPMFVCFDPITGTTTYTGHQVVTGARMEPVTPPGEVFVSQAYAALLAAGGQTRIEARYAGRVPLPKEAGFTPVFSLHLR